MLNNYEQRMNELMTAKAKLDNGNLTPKEEEIIKEIIQKLEYTLVVLDNEWFYDEI